QAIEDGANELVVSAVSTLEVGQLAFAGRIRLRGTVETWSQRATRSLALRTIDVTPPIAALAYSLPGSLHRDPADRILAATAMLHGCVLLTADERLLGYPHVMTRDARQ
ncbi:MAG TPA: type II toxin-antitoxin system VapC family toxin, partial [Candidatus Binatia bacterium]|nr:type II toxin-antitoxin system VapC family toxin [Candidatus Binatia bacterium]